MTGNVRSYLLFELAFHIAISAVRVYLFRAVLLKCLDYQGYSYLTAENFLDFLKNPLSIALFVIYLLLTVSSLLFELSVLSASFYYSEHGRRISSSGMILAGGHLMKSFLKRNPLTWVLGILTLVPFLLFHNIIRQLFHYKIINYAVRSIFLEWEFGWLPAVALVLLFFLCIFWILSVPGSLLTGNRLKDTRRESRKAVAGHLVRFLLSLLVWNLLIAAILIGLYLLAVVAAVIYVQASKDAAVALGAVLKIVEWIQVVTGHIAGAVGTIGNMALFYGMYRQWCTKSCILPLIPEETTERRPTVRLRRKQIVKVMGILLTVAELFYLGNLLMDRVTMADDILVSTQVTAHRGGAMTAPENTMSALENAVDALADYAEIDIQETKDGVLILMHDSNLKRTTGLDRKVWNATYGEIQELDAGRYFSEEYLGEPVPTLAEVLDYSKGKINLNIEIKSNGHNEGIVKKVVDMVKEYGMEDQCIITSMDYHFLKEIKELDPDLTTGYIMSVSYGNMANLKYADLLSVKNTYVTEGFVQQAHKEGKQVHVWTVNARGVLRRMANMGVDNLITDRTAVAREILAEEAGDTFSELLKYALR